MPQLVGLSESYMLIYERHKSPKEAAEEAAAAARAEVVAVKPKA